MDGMYQTSTGRYYYRSETNSTQLAKLSNTIQTTQAMQFTATNAFIVTWYLYPSILNINLMNSFQFIMVTDGSSSYFIFNYERLDFNISDPNTFYQDNSGNFYNFYPSVNGTNVFVPGQYIFRVDGGCKNIFLHLSFIG
jgi:hypothetical protein